MEKFEQKLSVALGDKELAKSMLKVYEQYLYCLGILDGDWSEYFQTEEAFHDFIKKYHFEEMKDSEVVDFILRENLDDIFFHELRVNHEIHDIFMNEEAEFYVDCGLFIRSGEKFQVNNSKEDIGIMFFNLNQKASPIHPFVKSYFVVKPHDNIPLSCFSS